MKAALLKLSDRLYPQDRSLLLGSIGIFALLLGSLIASIFLPRATILELDAWHKPIKFCLAAIATLLSLIWYFRRISIPTEEKLRCARVFFVVFFFEIVLIAVQVFRNRPSHFNYSTPLDAVIFLLMGSAIFIVLFYTMKLNRAVFSRQASAWPDILVTRLGLLSFLIGLLVGVSMVLPLPQQIRQLLSEPTWDGILGASRIGLKIGHPIEQFSGWEAYAGDLRISHFMGIHGLQVMLILNLIFTGILPSTKGLLLFRITSITYILAQLSAWAHARLGISIFDDRVTWILILGILSCVGLWLPWAAFNAMNGRAADHRE